MKQDGRERTFSAPVLFSGEFSYLSSLIRGSMFHGDIARSRPPVEEKKRFAAPQLLVVVDPPGVHSPAVDAEEAVLHGAGRSFVRVSEGRLRAYDPVFVQALRDPRTTTLGPDADRYVQRWASMLLADCRRHGDVNVIWHTTGVHSAQIVDELSRFQAAGWMTTVAFQAMSWASALDNSLDLDGSVYLDSDGNFVTFNRDVHVRAWHGATTIATHASNPGSAVDRFTVYDHAEIRYSTSQPTPSAVKDFHETRRLESRPDLVAASLHAKRESPRLKEIVEELVPLNLDDLLAPDEAWRDATSTTAAFPTTTRTAVSGASALVSPTVCAVLPHHATSPAAESER